MCAKAELQELDSQILLTQGQGSCGQGGTMMLMNMNTPPAPMSPPVYHNQQSSSVSNSHGGSVSSGGNNSSSTGGGGNVHHSSTLSSQPSSLGSSNGYGNHRQFGPLKKGGEIEPNLPQSLLAYVLCVCVCVFCLAPVLLDPTKQHTYNV